jgi:hypothetical protein
VKITSVNEQFTELFNTPVRGRIVAALLGIHGGRADQVAGESTLYQLFP